MTYSFIQQNLWLFIILGIWELVWKGVALWKAARKGQRNWFIALIFINTIGIFPIVYIMFFSKKKEVNK